jgi:hypothetical protein
MSIDWTKIAGYREDMTADEKLALLDSQEEENQPPAEPEPEKQAPAQPEPEQQPPAKPTSGLISKVQFDKVASELAKVKKELRARMTAEEQKEADRMANDEAMRLELEALRKEKTLNSYKASYLAQGYDERNAEDAATALADGDMDTVFALMKKQAVITEKALRAKILKEIPVPPAGDPPNADLEKKKELESLRASFGLPPLK